MCDVTRAPFVPIGSLATWTRISCPFWTRSSMGRTSRGAGGATSAASTSPSCARVGGSSSSPGMSEACRNAAFSRPMSTKAACIPGSTRTTLPL